MVQTNLFTSNLQGKALVTAKAETRKAINAALKDYEKHIDTEFGIVLKSTEKRSRDAGNAAKGKYKTAIEVVANCFPYQTEAGVLCRKQTRADGVRVWAEKKLTAAAARGIVRDSLLNFTKFVGKPEIVRVTIGAEVEEKNTAKK